MFDIGNLLLGITSTLIPFYWLFKVKEYSAKIYFGAIVFFLFIYSGAGVGLIGVHDLYWFYYLIYVISVSLGINFSKWSKTAFVKEKTSFKISRIIDKYGNTVIIVFLLLNIATLLYPEFLLHKLLIPPRPNLSANFALRFEDINKSSFEQILYFATQLATPFFYFALFKYRSKPITFLTILLIQPYIVYCREAYLGRGAMIMYMFIFIITVFKFKPQYRKWLTFILLILAPTLAIFLVNYASIRLGGEGSDLTGQTAIQGIIYSETSFPLWFSTIYESKYNFNDFVNYIMWIVTLPLPGFLKGNFRPQGYEISELLLGVRQGQRGFYVVLPGLVGESVYHFGKYFFWCHGLLFGFLIGSVYKHLAKYSQFYILLVYTAFQMSYMTTRGGTAAGYAFILKHLIYFYIIIYIVTHYKIKYVQKTNPR